MAGEPENLARANANPSAPDPCPTGSRRSLLVRRGFYYSIITIVWNVLEGLISIISGVLAGSVALIGFGVDSFVETTSAAVVGWRLYYELKGRSRKQAEGAERLAARVAGSLLLALALYILIDSGMRLLGLGPEPRPSFVGMAVTAVSLVVMPLLGRAKLKVAGGLGSRALRADAYETISCAWLSAATLAGLALNAVFGWWWADPAAALLLLPLIVREGLEGLKGEACECGEA